MSVHNYKKELGTEHITGVVNEGVQDTADDVIEWDSRFPSFLLSENTLVDELYTFTKPGVYMVDANIVGAHVGGGGGGVNELSIYLTMNRNDEPTKSIILSSFTYAADGSASLNLRLPGCVFRAQAGDSVDISILNDDSNAAYTITSGEFNIERLEQ